MTLTLRLFQKTPEFGGGRLVSAKAALPPKGTYGGLIGFSYSIS